jgi:hypothetical protein
MHDSQEGALASTGYLATSIPYFLTHISPANHHRFKEPTSGLEVLSCSSRVLIHALRVCARVCRDRISKLVSLLRLAACCTVMRSRWCQSGVNCTFVST